MTTPTYTAAVVSKSTPTNGHIAVTLRVNNDSMSDYSATLSVTAATTPADVQSWLATEKQKAIDLYTAMQAAQNALAVV